MTLELSGNAKAILLLTAPLIAGRNTAQAELLTPGEYKRLARHLWETQTQPADLLSPAAHDLIRSCHPVVNESRLQRLLSRGFLLSQVIERWQARAIWVVSRADAAYPHRLKARLRENAPAVLYGCGDIDLLDSGGLAVVGSRHVNDALIDYAVTVGQRTAQGGKSLVSGGAKGIDQAAMRGALEAGGKVTGVLADTLEKSTMERAYRNSLIGGQLVLISPYDPNAGFNVGNAMQRNKLIYALSDAALVVSSDLNMGGTWAGAVEQLDKLKLVPVYVRSKGERSAGLDALRDKGALSWPDPHDAASFDAVFSALTLTCPQVDLPVFLNEETFGAPSLPPSLLQPVVVSEDGREPAIDADIVSNELSTTTSSEEQPKEGPASWASNDIRPDLAKPKLEPADVVFAAVREALHHLLTVPMQDAEVAAALAITKPQAKAWLQRLVDEGFLEKQKKPAGYIVKPKRLFD